MAVTQYCDPIEPDGSAGYFSQSVNAQAITDINANNELVIMLMYEYDFLGDSSSLYTPTTSGGFVNTDGGTIRLGEYGGSTSDPKLTVNYTDATSGIHYSDNSGNFDDAWLRTNGDTSEANLLSARNAENGEFIYDSGTQGILGCYRVFSTSYFTRIVMRFATDSSRTASSATLSLYCAADVTSGFSRSTWHDKGIYISKMSSDVSTSFDTADWSHVEGWESSGSYAATDEAIVYNSVFFGSNF
tara:strand:- start:864 stop:1595 length:732 start_codon:yes stop_codon:yes gene_type:complete